MKPEQFNSSKKGHFKAVVNETEAGPMSYAWAGSDKMIIEFIEVNPAFSGKGVGRKMVLEAVNWTALIISKFFRYALSPKAFSITIKHYRTLDSDAIL